MMGMKGSVSALLGGGVGGGFPPRLTLIPEAETG